MTPDDFLAKTNPDALWDYELNDYANPEYRGKPRPSVPDLMQRLEDSLTRAKEARDAKVRSDEDHAVSPYPKAEEPE